MRVLPQAPGVGDTVAVPSPPVSPEQFTPRSEDQLGHGQVRASLQRDISPVGYLL